MSILQSIFFGTPGQYNIGGHAIEFREGQAYAFDGSCSAYNPAIQIVGKVADQILGSSILRFFTQGNLHSLVHELGHASAAKWLDPESRCSRIRIFTDSGTGAANTPPRRLRVENNMIIFLTPQWHEDIMFLAGPLADMLFSCGKLMLAVVLKNYISLPVALLFGVGAPLYMFGELLYAAISAISQDEGDFGKIAQSGSIPLLIATAALVGTCALGIFGAAKLW